MNAEKRNRQASANSTSQKRKKAKRTRNKERAERCYLCEEHVAFICQEIAEFRAVKTEMLVDACLANFPDYPSGKSEDRRIHWWADRICKNFPRDRWGNPTDKCKWKDRIYTERKVLQQEIKKRVPLANPYNRAVELTKLYEYCDEERERVSTYFEKTRNGERKQVTRVQIAKDVKNARDILDQLRREVGDDRPEANLHTEKPEPIKFVVEETPKKYYKVHDGDNTA